MKTLDKLVETIQQDPLVTRFKELEAIIDQDKELQQEYQQLLQLQKRMVQQEYANHKDYPATKTAYETKKEQLLQHVLMSEYLDLLDELNENLDMIQSILESEIAKDFD